MGSQAAQNQLWSRGADDWAAIQEGTVEDCYRYVLEYLPALKDKRVLDIGCGSGLFCHLAQTRDAIVTGMDASDGLIAAARKRNARVEFSVGEMERLPFDDETFDLVCGFNSFQFAANPLNAFAEARRVLKPGGTLVAMIWRLRRSPTSPSMRISTSSSRNITSPMASTLDNSGNLMFEPPRVTTRSSMPALGVGTMRSVWRV